ncbi:MAG: hypothetical protein F6J90_13250 [Moorea sp. SIOASIH]|uniref:hypothetical protein n=1 Tax=Moorena sp. SIOASIH TaxID=2607817 RepID=UPI0013B7D24E|nr:hypothetical protein [Moorena sp. SIOASIH]NEO37233.1 hypothetical protein [Moorena sp. SIOASIH]NEO94401.1 hypothetical protein [Moorena sp. SIO3G5]
MLKPIHPDGEGHPYQESDARYEQPHDHQTDWGTEPAITLLAPAEDIETLAVEDAL